LEKQNNAVKREFETRSQKVMLEIAEQGLNSQIYWKNTDPRRVVNVVPTSAITGEGVPDMIKLLVDLTQTRMVNSLMYISTLECTVLEVKVVEGLGTTIDVILSNGYLREGDKIVICGLNGPIVTQVRALLTPQPLRELRIKVRYIRNMFVHTSSSYPSQSAYVHHKEVKAANGVKVVAPDLDKAIAGSKLLVCGPDDDEDDLIEEVMRPLEDLLKRVSTTLVGVHVQASTLGSLEALLSFLESSKIPVSGIQIGPVHKRDVRRAMTQLEKAQEMACILCFDVPVDKEAEKLAEESGVRLFRGTYDVYNNSVTMYSLIWISSADIIYHLFDAFSAYNKEITEAKRRDQAPQAVWPCRLKIIAVFTKRDPIIVGVDIIEGTLRVGTPLCVVNAEKQIIKLGRM
jgi:translation initiation factor 5B